MSTIIAAFSVVEVERCRSWDSNREPKELIDETKMTVKFSNGDKTLELSVAIAQAPKLYFGRRVYLVCDDEGDIIQ
jgi:putative transposon-encoded protein